MFRWFTNFFFGHDDRQDDIVTPATPPGTRVVRDDGLEGTLSGVREVQDGQHVARVVFTGARSTWIEWVALEALQAA